MDTNTTTMIERHKAAAAALPKVAHLIGDSRRTDNSCGVYAHVSPTTGLVQDEIPLGGAREINDAVAAARGAYPAWRATSPTERRELLIRLSHLLRDRAADFVTVSALENGMTTGMATILNREAYEWTAYYAGWADKISGEVTRSSPEALSYTIPDPYGVIGIIVTWNGPVLSLAMKVAPALAAGNTVVIKPADFTPYTSQLFVQLCLDAGIPPGVVNLVHGGAEAGATLSSHKGVDKLSFTGGAITARHILTAAAQTMRPAVMELGGKSANLLFADADMAAALPFSVSLCMLHAGQGCAFPTRLLVEDSIYDQTLQGLQHIISQLPVGDPLLPATFMGPLVNHAAADRVMAIIERAKAENAGRMIAGGSRLDGEFGQGSFIQPTVFADVDPGSDLATKEVFGPVLSVMRFRTEAEAIALANATDYSLAAYVQSNDAGRIRRVAAGLRAGTISVNGAVPVTPHAPFGGMGLSGYGKEGGKAGLDEFIFQKTVLTQG